MSEKYQLLPHHEQQSLCTSRLPYRQGRKLTAVKVYSINNESKHLLIFGVPSLNLRQETKNLFLKYGKLLQFNITKYPSEQFTETYHAVYEDIQSARIAKKMLDTKNFYGSNLHICYAPELESVEEIKEKLLHRQRNVLARLKSLEKETSLLKKESLDSKMDVIKDITQSDKKIKPVFMGDVNEIKLSDTKLTNESCKPWTRVITQSQPKLKRLKKSEKKEKCTSKSTKISDTVEKSSCDIIDFTSTSTEVLTNINESLNYSNFGNEVIKVVPYKPVNKIPFFVNKKS